MSSQAIPLNTPSNDSAFPAREPKLEHSPYEASNQFTWRASIVGSFLGCFVGASNLYLGLKAGWVFSAGIFGAAFTFILIKLAIRLIPKLCPHFSMQENCIAQTAATTSGGLNVGFITCIPAMYRLNLLSENVVDDMSRLYLWTLSAATYGMFFAIPFRKWFVIRKEYPFPSPRATAETIKILHSSTGSDIPPLVKRQGIVMVSSFLASLTTTLSSHWISFFEEIHVLYWVGVSVGSNLLQSLDAKWGWFLSPSLPLIGSGFIVPLNVNLSFVFGAFLCYGVTGPVLVNNGFLTGATGFKAEGNGSAQSLFLWGGIALMLFSSLTEVLLMSASALAELRVLFLTLFASLRALGCKLFRITPPVSSPSSEREKILMDKDPVPASEQIPTSWWVLGILASMSATCLIMALSFQIPFYQTVLSVIFAFLFGIVAVQSAAETDINPVSTLAKVVQVVFSAFPAPTVADLQRSNLLCALVTAAGAAQSADMVSDLKTGQILETSPRAQFYAQLVGTVFGVTYMVPLFILYASAYPCIIREMDECPFGISGVLGWQNTALLLTKGLQIPAAAKYIALACTISAIVFTTIRIKLIPIKYHTSLPNLNAIGVGLILPQPSTPIAMAIGGIISYVWSCIDPSSHKKYHLVMGAGAMAGAGISAALKAGLALAEVPSNLVKFGSIPK